MPKIEKASLADQRSWRRTQLIEAAIEIALESGGQSVSVAAVAARAGLSRTSVYEYFASSADLISDLIIEELSLLSKRLEAEIGEIDDPYLSLEKWIAGSLDYVADGRHLIAKSLNSITIPRDRGAEIAIAHRKMALPLHTSLTKLGISDIPQALALLQSAIEVATKRIENGNDAEAETIKTTAFCIAGIKALT